MNFAGTARIGALPALAGIALAAACSRAPPADTAAPLGDRGKCAAYSGLPAGWGRDAHAGMLRIDGGDFELGSERGYADERPLATIHVDALWIDRTEVTNAQFTDFVAATGYVTQAERSGGSAVFRAPPESAAPLAPGSWWQLEPSANWRHPDGAGSGIAGREREPVVDVTYADASAYARWLGRELPGEAQWEFAAKAGRRNDESDRALRDAQGRPQANFWQGIFPVRDLAEDGFAGRAPVGCFAANPYGLHDMVGNVWEWTRDPYRDRRAAAGGALDEVAEPMPRQSAKPRDDRRVIKGGSFLCSADYCVRARASSRQPLEEDLPASHVGFRTIVVEHAPLSRRVPWRQAPS